LAQEHNRVWQAQRVNQNLGVKLTDEEKTETADRVVKYLIGITSKTELNEGHAGLWNQLLGSYEAWKRGVAA